MATNNFGIREKFFGDIKGTVAYRKYNSVLYENPQRDELRCVIWGSLFFILKKAGRRNGNGVNIEFFTDKDSTWTGSVRRNELNKLLQVLSPKKARARVHGDNLELFIPYEGTYRIADGLVVNIQAGPAFLGELSTIPTVRVINSSDIVVIETEPSEEPKKDDDLFDAEQDSILEE